MTEEKKENLQLTSVRPTYDLINNLAFGDKGIESFDNVKSTALFTICLLSLSANPKGYDALDAFVELFKSQRIGAEIKEEALASLATVANNSGVKLQEKTFVMLQELESYILEDELWNIHGFGGRLGYTVAVMADDKPINGFVNGQLSTVVDLEIVVEKRRAALA